jgi:hypothetical protein
MKKSMLILEILVGLLVLIVAVVGLYPLIFGIPFGVQFMVFGTIILGITILAVGIFGVASVFSYETLSLAKKIKIATSLLTIEMAVIILYFQVTGAGAYWLHVLFGLALLGYAVGRVIIGGLTRENKSGLRVYYSAIGIAVGVLSLIVMSFQMIATSSKGIATLFLSYGYFVRIALILIGVDCLMSAILIGLLNKQKQSPIIEVANPPLPE